MEITARAYGKLNLLLAITGRLPNGYHSLLSVMQSVSLCNRVTVRRGAGGRITLQSDDASLPTGSGNTAFRAAERFLAAAGLPAGEGLDIYVEKRVPYQAGMGSASADAAGVLAAANALYGYPLTRGELLEAALSVGADVPFCLTGGCMLAEGIGERLTALSALPPCGFVILHPGKGISTPEAYRRFDALKDPRQPDSRACADAIASGSLEAVARRCGNVFEQCCDIQEVFELKEALLKAGALAACMTGSGTAVFGIFESMEAAGTAAPEAAGGKWRSWTAAPVSCGVEIE